MDEMENFPLLVTWWIHLHLHLAEPVKVAVHSLGR